jgi:hypothetical protein
MNTKERQENIAESPISFDYLKRFNTGAGILHLIQGILMLSLGSLLTWERTIYTFYLKHAYPQQNMPSALLTQLTQSVPSTSGHLIHG